MFFNVQLKMNKLGLEYRKMSQPFIQKTRKFFSKIYSVSFVLERMKDNRELEIEQNSYCREEERCMSEYRE